MVKSYKDFEINQYQTNIIQQDILNNFEKIIYRNQYLNEINDYNTLSTDEKAISYETHTKKIDKILSNISKDILNAQPKQIFSTNTQGNQLEYISSVEDATNVNDKIWKLALKVGGVSKTTDTNNPNLFYITMKFTDLSEIRYVYRLQPDLIKNERQIQVKYLEFEWFVLGKRLYNRIINRNEIWNILFEDKDISLLDIKNEDSDTIYDRRIMFRN